MPTRGSGKNGRILIGVGGWVFEPWRGVFYPEKWPQKRELEYASSHLTSIEINGTFYGSQKPDSFARWHDETPENFVFALKGPRFATNRRVLAEAGSSIERFFDSGVMRLQDKLGPINWQFAPTKQFDPVDFAAFLDLLPKRIEGRPIRHAVEVRHDSFRVPEFVELLRAHEIAVVVAGDSKYPVIPDVTAPFVYIRAMGTKESEARGYGKKALDSWAAHARAWAGGQEPAFAEPVTATKMAAVPRDVHLYVISGHKIANPAAAMALIARVKE